MAAWDGTDYRILPSSHTALLDRTALRSPDHKTLGGRAPQGNTEAWQVDEIWNRVCTEMRQSRGCPGSRQERPKERFSSQGSRGGGLAGGVGGWQEGRGQGGASCRPPGWAGRAGASPAASAAQAPAGTAAPSLHPDPQPRPTDVSFPLQDRHGRKCAHRLMAFWSPNRFRLHLPTPRSPAGLHILNSSSWLGGTPLVYCQMSSLCSDHLPALHPDH